MQARFTLRTPMRIALFALLLSLPLAACDPDANADTETPTAEPAPIEDGAPGDTGLPDTLATDIDAIDPAEVQGAEAPAPTE